MNEHDERDLAARDAAGQGDEVRVRKLLEAAGPRPEVPEEDLETIVAAARSEWLARRGEEGRPAGRSVRRRRLAVAAGLAAALAVALGLAWWWWSPRTGAPREVVARIEASSGPVELAGDGGTGVDLPENGRLPAGTEIRTGAERADPGGRLALRLVTGTEVRLDAGTRVRLVSARVLKLVRGAVYVDTRSTEEGGTRLRVRTPLGTARDVGTRFTVRLLGAASGAGAEALRVQVRDGEVEIRHRRRTHRAGAGHELLLHRDGAVERREVGSFPAHWEWVLDAAPPFEIDGRTLDAFLDWVSAETGWRIVYEDPALAASAEEVVLHGSLGAVRADRAPFVVLPGAGLEGELGGGVLVVRRGPSR